MTLRSGQNDMLAAAVRPVLSRWPAAGLATGVVRDGSLTWFQGFGVADVPTRRAVDEDTVFRIASITKTFTSIAVAQLWEQGMLDLDAPVTDRLHSFSMRLPRGCVRAPTVRQLLTHTAGVRAVRHPSDLLRPAAGWGASAHGVPDLADYYRRGLRVDVEPGTRWAYSNHGFTALGCLVEDVSGIPFHRYLRERIFDPLGMGSTDLIRSERVRSRLATGYALRSRGLRPVADLEVVTAGGGGAYSTTADMARYVSALLAAGIDGDDRLVRPATLEAMFAPQYQPDPRLPGMGLGFFRGEVGGRRTIWHDGIWMGFLADMVLAPDDGFGVLAFANTGNFEPRGVTGPAARALVQALLDARAEGVEPAPERPWTWDELCGWYAFGPGVLMDPQPRMLLGAGLEVVVRAGRLTVRGQTPIPAVRRGLPLLPDEDDPTSFRLDLTALGAGIARVVFSRDARGDVAALHLGLLPMSFTKRPDSRNPRPWAEAAAAGALAAAGVAIARRRRA